MVALLRPRRGGGGVLPITAYPGRLHPKGPQVYERIGISLAVAYKKAGKLVISICKKV